MVKLRPCRTPSMTISGMQIIPRITAMRTIFAEKSHLIRRTTSQTIFHTHSQPSSR